MKKDKHYKNVISLEVTKSDINKFLKEVMLDGDMIQESAEDDKLFRGEGALKWQLRAFVEWLESPCTDHRDNLKFKVTHGICTKCRRIANEALKGGNNG